ncbi:hypothetical protein AB4Z09_27240 [Rhodococcus sp. TAF43]|uniref:hypothetical protein n=1 Tax=Rhodococcus sp. TAF43 TaxID=3237483 RepID=UPI003F97EBE9
MGSILTLAAAVLLVLISVPLMFTTMRTEGGNCGTVWAASDTWTFKSTYDGPEGYFRSSRSPEASVRAAVNDLWADMQRGSDVYDACESLHEDRRTLLFVLSGMTVVFLGVGGGLWMVDRRRS